MLQRSSKKRLVLSLLIVLLFVTFQEVSQGQQANKNLRGKRPNIILVMTDDQGMGDLSCMGNKVLKTPNLDKLYAQSTRFTEFHVSPTCAPTRSAIMSGRHEFKNGVTHTILERERMSLATVTIAEILRQAGYATGIFGKWHLGDEEAYQPHNRGFEEVFIHGAGGIGQKYACSCADSPPNQKTLYFDPVIRHNKKFVKTKGFCTDVFFQEALNWIKKQKDSKEPFFAYITPNAPHGPMLAPEKYKKVFRDMGFNEQVAARYGMIANIDENMGLLMRKLADWGLEENTLLIFMTDNGQAGGRFTNRNGQRVMLFFAGLRGGKGTVYEGGTHVPAFWRWKGTLPAGKDINTLAAHIDLFPTFVDIANAKVPAKIQKRDGRSLLPLLKNQETEWPDRYLFSHKGRWAKGANPDKSKFKDFSIRSQRFRLVNGKELYDISMDPGEKTNVIEKHPKVVEKMMAAYNDWWKETRPLLVNEMVPNSQVQPFHEVYNRQAKNEGIPNWQRPNLEE